ncbi:MAG: putative porin [Marinilabiliaceae bacterium]|nr:putative porin [Marinilabiliaceae bacterium]
MAQNTGFAKSSRTGGGGASPRNTDEKGAKKVSIKPHVKAWRMIDDMSHADTIAVDTLLNLHQINNPIWKNNLMNVTLGVLGSPSVSTFFPQIRRHDGYIFYNSTMDYIPQTEQMIFYNTLTPYTNVTYQMGYPKLRSEEYVHALFTQNVNSRVNIGFQYSLSTSIGRFDSQRTDNSRFRLWSSFDGDYYRGYLNLQYNHSDISENGGILNDSYVMYPDSFQYDKAEDIPVQYTDSKNIRSVYELLYSHSLDLGHVTRTTPDSLEYEVAPAEIRHTIAVHRSHSHFFISNLSTYDQIKDQLFPNDPMIDNVSTHDGRKYMEIKNRFELKMNEEFNSLLRFGLRAYFGVDVRQYRWDAPTTYELDSLQRYVATYHRSKENEVVTYLGGQLFKNQGDHLQWRAGARLYMTGYKAGDFEVNGDVSVKFNIASQPTNLYGKLWFSTTSPELFQERYTSNHYSWNHVLETSNQLKYEGGISMPNLRMRLYAFGGTLTRWVYFNEEALPSQKDGVVQVVGLYGEKHFSVIGFNSIVRLAWQQTSDMEVMPLPNFSLQASNFYEAFLFNVLRLQVGFDVRYNTSYFAPKYVPAIMQFCAQTEREVGNYGYFDPFVNLHLKKIRIYVKYEHVNYLWGSHDAFHTIGYPASPNAIKFGLSWNFYD